MLRCVTTRSNLDDLISIFVCQGHTLPQRDRPRLLPQQDTMPLLLMRKADKPCASIALGPRRATELRRNPG